MIWGCPARVGLCHHLTPPLWLLSTHPHPLYSLVHLLPAFQHPYPPSKLKALVVPFPVSCLSLSSVPAPVSLSPPILPWGVKSHQATLSSPISTVLLTGRSPRVYTPSSTSRTKLWCQAQLKGQKVTKAEQSWGTCESIGSLQSACRGGMGTDPAEWDSLLSVGRNVLDEIPVLPDNRSPESR